MSVALTLYGEESRICGDTREDLLQAEVTISSNGGPLAPAIVTAAVSGAGTVTTLSVGALVSELHVSGAWGVDAWPLELVAEYSLDGSSWLPFPNGAGGSLTHSTETCASVLHSYCTSYPHDSACTRGAQSMQVTGCRFSNTNVLSPCHLLACTSAMDSVACVQAAASYCSSSPGDTDHGCVRDTVLVPGCTYDTSNRLSPCFYRPCMGWAGSIPSADSPIFSTECRVFVRSYCDSGAGASDPGCVRSALVSPSFCPFSLAPLLPTSTPCSAADCTSTGTSTACDNIIASFCSKPSLLATPIALTCSSTLATAFGVSVRSSVAAGALLRVSCPQNCNGLVYGSDWYSALSLVCPALRHALGSLTEATLVVSEAQMSSFSSSFRNGVATVALANNSAAFRFSEGTFLICV